MEEENNMIVEREELMISSINGGLPTFRKAHFLKPVSNPTNQPHPDLSSLCLPLNPNYIQLINKRVSFHGMLGPLKSWKSWVDNMEQAHQEIWKKVGIFEAIRASTYHIVKDNKLIIKLAERWCSETNTFFFPWGESTITLEDAMILGGFSVLGSSARSHSRIMEGGDILKELVVARKKINKSNSFHVSHSKWMSYFRGKGGEIEHVAFVVLWLSRNVFTTNSYGRISPKVFSIAISLTRGTRIALAPAVLATIYSDLRLLNEKIVTCKCNGQDDGSKLVVWAPFHLVQIWVWERFPTLGLKPSSLAHGQPRLARWQNVKKLKLGILRLILDSSTGDNFLWRPYALHLKNWEFPKFYCDQEMWVSVKPEVDEQYLSFAKCLRTFVLVGVNCMEQYLPQRVAMQFGLDQDVPFCHPRPSVVTEVAWNSYDKPLDGLKFYLPPQSIEGGVTFQYYEWWRTMLSVHDDCESWRRSTTKLKKDSKVVSDADHECSNSVGSSSSRKMQNYNSSFCKANAPGEDTILDLQARPEHADTCKENVVAEKEERQVNQSNMNMGEASKSSEGNLEYLQNETHLSWLLHACNEAMSSEFVGSIASETQEHVSNEVGLVDLMNPLIGVEEDERKFECNGMEQEKEKEVNESCINTGEDTRTQPEGDRSLCGAEPLIQVNTLPRALVEDEQGEAREDARSKEVNSSHVNLMILSDEEDNGDFDAFEVQCLAIDARISRLERMVSARQARKAHLLKSKNVSMH
uniref:Aminotransferase-like plant mobile domain-containing protein n=2 Tax=Chenopodium quinoa TaxID=63459 RepID=A0A803LYC8_CHEQI